jgi:hypothetical protein
VGRKRNEFAGSVLGGKRQRRETPPTTPPIDQKQCSAESNRNDEAHYQLATKCYNGSGESQAGESETGATRIDKYVVGSGDDNDTGDFGEVEQKAAGLAKAAKVIGKARTPRARLF